MQRVAPNVYFTQLYFFWHKCTLIYLKNQFKLFQKKAMNSLFTLFIAAILYTCRSFCALNE